MTCLVKHQEQLYLAHPHSRISQTSLMTSSSILGIGSGLFCIGFPSKTQYAFFVSPILATLPDIVAACVSSTVIYEVSV
jgi:hypothetical protein